MDSPPSNAEVNAHNSSVRNSDKNDGSISSEIPTQYPMGAAVVPSTPDNQAFMVEDRSSRCEAMGVASVPSPPNYQSSMADCHPQTSRPLGVISSNSPPNIHSITTGRDQQQPSRPMDMASNQSPANYASFTQFSQPKSKGIIIISILHFVGGLLTCGLGIALYFLWRSNDSRFYLHMGFIGHTILVKKKDSLSPWPTLPSCPALDVDWKLLYPATITKFKGECNPDISVLAVNEEEQEE